MKFYNNVGKLSKSDQSAIWNDYSRSAPYAVKECLNTWDKSVLQIRRGNRDDLGIIFLILHKNIHCDPSLEPSCQDGSNEGSQHMFSLRNKKNYL